MSYKFTKCGWALLLISVQLACLSCAQSGKRHCPLPPENRSQLVVDFLAAKGLSYKDALDVHGSGRVSPRGPAVVDVLVECLQYILVCDEAVLDNIANLNTPDYRTKFVSLGAKGNYSVAERAGTYKLDPETEAAALHRIMDAYDETLRILVWRSYGRESRQELPVEHVEDRR